MGYSTNFTETWQDLTQEALEKLSPELHASLKAEVSEALQRHNEGATIRYPVQLHARLVLKVTQNREDAWKGADKQQTLAKVLKFKPEGNASSAREPRVVDALLEPIPLTPKQRETMLANLKELTAALKEQAGIHEKGWAKAYPTMNDRNHKDTMEYLASIKHLPMTD